MSEAIKKEIKEWARDNYEESYAAQTVIECWDEDDKEFEEYESLADFISTYVEGLDDRYNDARNA
jgi:hypothetical protein